MHIHILGICGTFMGGIALIARQLGHKVTGSDQNVYPPMSTQLQEQGIELCQGYNAEDIKQLNPDLVVIGNAMSRGNEAVEYVLNNRVPYTSGPEWLSRYALHDKWVLAAAGTHGKTTTSSMLAWILEDAQLNPGFLIGGVPENFGLSARITDSPFFVVEADEYDTAFFDKRSKFVHYHPRTLIINNLEFDHADIFKDLHAIQTQFHHLVRTVPGTGLIIYPKNVPAIDEMLAMGCWSECEIYNGNLDNTGTGANSDVATWRYRALAEDYSAFELQEPKGEQILTVRWELIGEHNMFNGIAAIAAARHAGVPAKVAVEGLSKFKNVKRRMELKGVVSQVAVYDDFAHHPTAIETTLSGLRAKVGQQRIIAITDLRSNTMQAGIHKDTLLPALEKADINLIHMPASANWSFDETQLSHSTNASVYTDSSSLLEALMPLVQTNDHILVMSNGGFDGIHQKILERLKDLNES